MSVSSKMLELYTEEEKLRFINNQNNIDVNLDDSDSDDSDDLVEAESEDEQEIQQETSNKKNLHTDSAYAVNKDTACMITRNTCDSKWSFETDAEYAERLAKDKQYKDIMHVLEFLNPDDPDGYKIYPFNSKTKAPQYPRPATCEFLSDSDMVRVTYENNSVSIPIYKPQCVALDPKSSGMTALDIDYLGKTDEDMAKFTEQIQDLLNFADLVNPKNGYSVEYSPSGGIHVFFRFDGDFKEGCYIMSDLYNIEIKQNLITIAPSVYYGKGHKERYTGMQYRSAPGCGLFKNNLGDIKPMPDNIKELLINAGFKQSEHKRDANIKFSDIDQGVSIKSVEKKVREWMAENHKSAVVSAPIDQGITVVFPCTNGSASMCLVCKRIHKSNNPYITYFKNTTLCYYKCHSDRINKRRMFRIIETANLKSLGKQNNSKPKVADLMRVNVAEIPILPESKMDMDDLEYRWLDVEKKLVSTDFTDINDLLERHHEDFVRTILYTSKSSRYMTKDTMIDMLTSSNESSMVATVVSRDKSGLDIPISIGGRIMKLYHVLENIARYIPRYYETTHLPFDVPNTKSLWRRYVGDTGNLDDITIDQEKLDLVINFYKEVWFNNREDIFTWFINWLRMMINEPLKKTRVALLLYSKQQQVGKNLGFGFLSDHVFGKHTTTVYNGIDDLNATHNESIGRSKLNLVDELAIEKSQYRKSYDQLKNILTEQVRRVNGKYKDICDTRDISEYMFLSNNKYGFHLEEHDARMVCCEIQIKKELEYFNNLSNNGFTREVGKMFYKYIREYPIVVDVRDIPDTDYREDLKNRGSLYTAPEDPLEGFYDDLMNNVEEFKNQGGNSDEKEPRSDDEDEDDDYVDPDNQYGGFRYHDLVVNNLGEATTDAMYSAFTKFCQEDNSYASHPLSKTSRVKFTLWMKKKLPIEQLSKKSRRFVFKLFG